MPNRRTLTLTIAQQKELEGIRDRHPKGHMREKAAVLLQIAAGMSPHAAARRGGLKPHHPDTIYQWLTWYETGGVARLAVQPGRGRKAAFSP